MTDLEAVKNAIQPNTKLFYVETPSNPTLKVTDIKAISDIAKEHDALTFVDNTFLTPALQKPLHLGQILFCTVQRNSYPVIVMLLQD